MNLMQQQHILRSYKHGSRDFGSRNVRMGFDKAKGVLVIQKYINGAYVTKIEV
jgi:hypothetical protein